MCAYMLISLIALPVSAQSLLDVKSDLITYAKSFIGKVPYVWGGTSLETGVDCSGYICCIYDHYGINLWGRRTEMINLVSDGVAINVGTNINDAQLGDIIYTSGHVSLYSGNGNVVNALNTKYGVIECPATTGWIGSIIAIIRIKDSYFPATLEPENHPTNVHLEINKSLVSINETISFDCTGQNMTGYTVGINRNGQRICTENVLSHFEKSFDTPGHYTAYVTGWNSVGLSDSNVVSFTVYNSKPTKAGLYVNKDTVGINKNVTFSCSSDVARGYTIGIYRDGQRILTQDISSEFTKSFDTPGRYTAYVTAWNSYGTYDSNWVGFDVYNCSPQIANLTSDKDIVGIGEGINISCSTDYAYGFTLAINREGVRISTEVLSQNVIKSFDEPGIYTAYMTIWNEFGSIDTNLITFRVVDYSHQYTNRVRHWLWGFKNGEGNNGYKTAFLLDETYWTGQYGTNQTYTESLLKSIRGITTAKKVFSSSFNGLWTDYDLPYSFNQPTSDTYAEIGYNPIQYTINYELNGGTNNANNPSEYNVLYGVSFAMPSKEGYTFKGWKDENANPITGINEGCNALFENAEDFYNKINSRTIGDRTITAQWDYIPPHTETQVVKNGNSYDISVSQTNLETAKIIVAGYKNNKVVDMEILNNDNLQTTFTGDFDTFKIMAWENLSTIKPLCEAEIIPQSKWIIE